MALGVFPAIARAIITIIAIAIVMMRQIISLSVYIARAKYFKCFYALNQKDNTF